MLDIIREIFTYAGGWNWLWRMLLQIFILAFLIYKALYYLRGTRGANVLAGIVLMLLILSTAAVELELEAFIWLMDGLWTIMAVALIVIFQPELRRAFAQLGSYAFWRRDRKRETIAEVSQAVRHLSERKVGALIVLERKIGMQNIIDDAVKIDVKPNALLIESVFYPNAPLHDGAMIIRDGRIVAVRAILPLSRQKLSRTMGTRHRAAIGITEETDAVAVVVSEETGKISIACHGGIIRDLTGDNLQTQLRELLLSEYNSEKDEKPEDERFQPAGGFDSQVRDEEDLEGDKL